MPLTAYYRVTERGNGKPRPPWFTPQRALRSFLTACRRSGRVDVVVVADGGVPAELAPLVPGEVVLVRGGSAPRSFRRLLDVAVARTRPDELVWFAEDDHLYHPEAVTRLREAAAAVPAADYFSLYQPDNDAWHRTHASQPGRHGPSRRFDVAGTGWRRCYDSTSTFGLRGSALLADHRLLRLCSRAGGPWDNTCVLVTQGVPPYAWRHLYSDLYLRPSRASAGRVVARPVVRAAANLLAMRQRRAWLAPEIPLATHAEVGYVAPGHDWAAIAAAADCAGADPAAAPGAADPAAAADPASDPAAPARVPVRPRGDGAVMPLPWSAELSGRLDRHTVAFETLRGNPLGDPVERPLLVYVPPGYDDEPERRYPSIYVLQGYTGHVAMWDNRAPYRLTFPEAADGVFARGEAPPAIVVFVDAWTAYGGSQFVDSPGTGSYHTYLCDEVVPWVDAHYRTLPAAGHRGVTGKSSGGFGAFITPMLRPDLFGGLASHAGDSLYEYCYLDEFAKATRALREYDGDIWAWWADLQTRPGLTRPTDGGLLMTLGCSAAFSADPDGTVQLPFDTRSGRLREDLWQRWLDWDPVRMVPRHADALRGQRAIWIDAGTRDEWYLDLGAQAMVDALAAIGVTDVHFDSYDAGHGGIDWRYPLSLAFLATRLSPVAV